MLAALGIAKPDGVELEVVSEDLGQGETGGSDSDVNQLSEFYRNARVQFDNDPKFAERARARIKGLAA